VQNYTNSYNITKEEDHFAFDAEMYPNFKLCAQKDTNSYYMRKEMVHLYVLCQILSNFLTSNVSTHPTVLLWAYKSPLISRICSFHDPFRLYCKHLLLFFFNNKSPWDVLDEIMIVPQQDTTRPKVKECSKHKWNVANQKLATWNFCYKQKVN